MQVYDKRTGLEVLDDRACFDLLHNGVVGRVVAVDGDRPEIFPVNYSVAGDNVLFRTAAGTKLETALAGPVAFEVDAFDPEDRTGWSVVIHGRAELVNRFGNPEETERLTGLPVDPWAAGEKEFLVRIVPATITGRRVGEMVG